MDSYPDAPHTDSLAQTAIAAAPATAQTLQDAYKDQVLTHGRRPVSVYVFAKRMGMAEADFYKVYNNFDALEQAIWTGLVERTVARLKADPTYAGYSAREKLLSYYFTWVETLRTERSYVIYSMQQSRRAGMRVPTAQRPAREKFLRFADEVINEGYDKGELVARPLLSDRYANGLWYQLAFVTRYWAQDTSPEFESTDAAIEKAVRLSFELMGANVVDAAADFVKFLWQRR